MYLNFFGLREQPFAITPDPAYLYLSPRHQEALGHLLYGAGPTGGFVQLTGEVGTGKTTMIRTLLAQKLTDVDVAIIINPRQSELEFVASICDELHIPYKKSSTIKTLVDSLNVYLLDAHSRGRRTLLIIDEAQNLAPEVLEQVRLLTNLETHKDKLLRIMLVGQPELAELLARDDLRQLASRITARYHLTPLTSNETRAYIAHRLRIAGGDVRSFAPSALSLIHKLTQGVPRNINILCDRALLGAYARGVRPVTKDLVRRAAKEVRGEVNPGRMRLTGGWSGFDVALVVLIFAVMGAAFWWRAPEFFAPAPAEPEPVAVAAPVAPAAVEPPPAAAPALSSELDQVLAQGESLGSVLARLIRIWNVAPQVEEGEPLCKALVRLDLMCYRGTGNWTDLEQINRPAVLALSTGRGDTRHALLSGFDGKTAVLETRKGVTRISADQLDLLWNGDFLLLWKRETASTFLLPDSLSPDVRWLRTRLAKAEGRTLTGEPSDYFDLPLRDEVVRYQQKRSLIADGVVGLRTLIALSDFADTAPPILKAR
ncbi:MAG: AAA family ATPase [Pseudomonadota bacterium]